MLKKLLFPIYSRLEYLVRKKKPLPYRSPVKKYFTYKDPFKFKRLSLSDLHQREKEGIFLKTETLYENWIRKKPAFLDDPDQCGIFPDFQNETFFYKQPFVIFKRNITVVGARTFLVKNKWFNDESYIPNLFENDIAKLKNYKNRFLNESTGFTPTPLKTTFRLDSESNQQIILRDRVLVLCSLEADNYGSWLFRVLPKLYCVQKLNIHFDQILIEAKHPRLLDFLKMMGIGPEKIVQHDRNCIYHLRQAIIPALNNPQCYLDTPSQELFKEFRNRYGLPTNGDKIFISRLNHAQTSGTTRVLLNEKELVDELIKLDFKIIYPEKMTLEEQIKTFSSASVVVGPSGSAMFNVVFCHPNTKVIDIESEPHWIHAHMSLFSSLKLDYGLFVGKVDPTDTNEVHRRWSVNIPALIERIKSFTN
jgi:hypothetical protein